jgi:predicted permease
MKELGHSPPRLLLRFFRWYCHPRLADHIEGDLIEVYRKRVQKSGKRNADIRFAIDVILLFRRGIIRRADGTKKLNTYGMYKNYVKIGWRNLIKNKSYTLLNVAGLALSMTCGIYIFSLVKLNLGFDNFHPDSERIYRVVTELHRDVIGYQDNVPSPLGEHFRNDYTYAEKTARVYTETGALVILRKGNELAKFKEPQGVSFTETSFFEIFNFPLVQGDQATALTVPNTAIITERIARKYFEGRSAIGETFWLNNKHPFTVTGVLKDLPPNTDFKSEIFVSFATLKDHDQWLATDDGWNGIRDGMKCYVLLRPGAPVHEVEAAMSAYVKIYRPTSKNVHHYKLQQLADVHFNPYYGGAVKKQTLWVLSVIGLFLIGTACVNFINLATAQAMKRSKEVGVRKVLGGAKTQLFWQFIMETAIITFTGIIAASILTYMISPVINNFFRTQVPINLFADGTLALFIVVLGIVVTFLAGYYPGMVLSGYQPVSALSGKLHERSGGGFNTRRSLIVVQFAISQVLLIGMVVIMDQMRYAMQADLGFDKEAIVLVRTGDDTHPAQRISLKNEISRIRGVDQVSLCFMPPSSEHDWGNSIRLDNNTEEVNFRTSIKSADADYVSLFGLEIVAGRNLTPSDSVKEMVINEAMVRKLNFNTPEEALGHIIVANGGGMRAPIVGVVKDFHDKSFHEEIHPVLITTYVEDYYQYAVKLNMTDARSTLAEIEKMWVQLHPNEIFEYDFLDDSIARFYENEKSSLRLIQAFSFIAIFIGCLGLYGLVSFMVSQKTKEIGIRKVLGGTAAHIAWIFGKEFLRLIVIAFAVAAPIGWWLMNKWLEGFQFQTDINAGTFALAISCSLVVAAITVCSQVISTALMNPVKSLRVE